jgi:hypothetical protein
MSREANNGQTTGPWRPRCATFALSNLRLEDRRIAERRIRDQSTLGVKPQHGTDQHENLRTRKSPHHPSSTVTEPDCFSTAGGFHEPSRIEGGLSLGQYKRNIKMNLPVEAGSQFDSLFAPGDAFWM